MQTEKTKKELIILISGVAILAGIWVMKGRQPKAAAPGPLSVETESAKIEQNAKDEFTSAPFARTPVREIRYTGRQNKDPIDNNYLFPEELLEPAAESVQQEVADFPIDKFKVTAVLWGSKRPQAVINDSVMGIGEALDGGKIVGIDKEGIHVSYEGKEVLLQLK